MRGIEYEIEGKKLVFGLLTLGYLERKQKEGDSLQMFDFKAVGDVLLDCVRQNHPDVTRDFIVNSLTPGDATALLNRIVTESGLDTGKKEAARN